MDKEIWKKETKGGMELETCDLNDVEKIEFKPSRAKSTEEKLSEALTWIEDYKKKSIKHDEILKLLTYGVTFCLLPSIILVFLAVVMGAFVDIVTIFGYLPIVFCAAYAYNVLRKIKKANKD